MDVLKQYNLFIIILLLFIYSLIVLFHDHMQDLINLKDSKLLVHLSLSIFGHFKDLLKFDLFHSKDLVFILIF